LEFRKHHQIDITKRSAVFENFSDSNDINRAWENTKEEVKTSAKENLCLYEMRQHKPWFVEEC
jgi:hypothetical protein